MFFNENYNMVSEGHTKEVANSLSLDDLKHLRSENQVLQETCTRLTQQLQDIAEDPISWLLLTQTKSVEKPTLFKYPYEAELVTVIIPAFNAEKFIENAVKSVWNQETNGEIRVEVIIIDDGSSDNTYEVANQLAQKSPIPMQVLTHPDRANKGVAASRNLGIIESKGEWISFLDADDAFLPNKTLVQVTWLKQNPDSLCVCSYGYNVDSDNKPLTGWNTNQIAGDYQTIDLKDRIAEPYTFDSLQKGCPIVNSTFLTHRDVLLWSGLLPEFIAHQAEDWVLFARISLKWSISVIKEPLIYYRVHPSSWTTRYFMENLDYGVRLEFLFSMTHWLACRQEFKELAKKYYRKNLPSFFSVPARVNSWLNEYLESQQLFAQSYDSQSLKLVNQDIEGHLTTLRNEINLAKKIYSYKQIVKKITGFNILIKIKNKLKLLLKASTS